VSDGPILSPATVVKSARCLLRRIDELDAEFVYSALSTPGFTDGLLQARMTEVAEATRLIQTFTEAWQEGTRFAFAITNHNSEFLGFINLMKRDEPNLWSVGFWVMPDHWGRGFALEASRALFDVAFSELKAERIHAAHVHWNQQSAKVLSKLGMQLKLRREQGIQKNGEWIPNLHYEITRADWLQR
jgi:[ribosomal protein S5]-alanine N-acetyltransferase